ncbi:Protransforming growth factor alpha (Fragment) [Lemmus lemmus]
MSCARSDLRLFAPADSPVAAAVVSHFNDCPDSHTQFCFHGTCRFLVQEEKPACVGLKIPEEEFGQVTYGSPTSEKLLGTMPPAVPTFLGHAGRLSLFSAQSPVQPSVLCRPSKLCGNSACWASSAHPREEASRPCFKTN